jgi:3'-5' exoribonuclease
MIPLDRSRIGGLVLVSVNRKAFSAEDRMQSVLKVGDRIEKVMVVAKKVRRDFTGGKFLLFQFSDMEGVLKGVLWEPTDDVESGVLVDDIVRVSGEIQEYQGALQLRIGSIEKLTESEYDPSLFLPSSNREVEKLYDEILKIITGVNNENLRALLQVIFEETEFRKRLLRAPAAKGWHHSYIGGLVEHLYDMLQLAFKAAELYPDVDRDLLTAGVLLHDLGKIEELSITNHIDYSDGGRLLGHITLGVEFLDEYLRGMHDFPRELALRLKHMIVSHHGLLENGSPIVPMTLEAMLLHYIDNLDAQVRGVSQVLEKSSNRESNWTEYVRLLDRYIYKGREESEE